MSSSNLSLSELGWSGFFQSQLSVDEGNLHFARVFAVQRTGLTLLSPGTEVDVPLGGRWFQLDAQERPTVGDWVVQRTPEGAIDRVLTRKSLIKRVTSGRTSEVQLIAANVDTLFLVTSCNQEFNLSRLERYLALAFEAAVQPVVVLTKADLCSEPEVFADQVRTLRRDLVVETINALDADSLSGVRAWCASGQTVALLGSSGVGKSTLVNSLSGAPMQVTGVIRDDDDKGKHTTTHRSLHLLAGGGLLLDSPGMRELQVADVGSGVEEMFAEVGLLANQCRFSDCQHSREPGCAVQAAIADGRLDGRRLTNYQKLLREERHSRETIAERHARSREFGKKVKAHVAYKDKRRI